MLLFLREIQYSRWIFLTSNAPIWASNECLWSDLFCLSKLAVKEAVDFAADLRRYGTIAMWKHVATIDNIQLSDYSFYGAY